MCNEILQLHCSVLQWTAVGWLIQVYIQANAIESALLSPMLYIWVGMIRMMVMMRMLCKKDYQNFDHSSDCSIRWSCLQLLFQNQCESVSEQGRAGQVYCLYFTGFQIIVGSPEIRLSKGMIRAIYMKSTWVTIFFARICAPIVQIFQWPKSKLCQLFAFMMYGYADTNLEMLIRS